MVWILTSCEIVWRKKLNDRCREVLINRRVHHQCLLLLARLDLFVQCQTVKLQIRMFPLTFWLFNYPSTNNSDVNHFLLSVLNSSSRFNHLQEEKMTCFQRNLELLPRLFLFSSFFVAVRNITKSSICLPHVLQDGSWLPFRVQEGREWFHSGINGTWLFFF